MRILILNEQKCLFYFFYKIREQEGRTGPVWEGWYQWEEERGEERMWEGEYVATTVYTCM
jgi:hypothetical protein